MKNKVFKKLAAAGAALMMAVTGMAMSASAETWSVYFSSTGIPKFSDQKNFTPSSNASLKKLNDTCTAFTQTENTYGLVSYVTYYAQCKDNNGNVKYSCMPTHYYFHSNPNNPTISLTNSVPQYYTLSVSHTLQSNGNYSSMNGSVSASV